jgi:hypothetical protein
MSTVNGYQLFDVEPDFATVPLIRGTRAFDLVNVGPGPAVASYRGKRAIHTLHHTFELLSRSEVDSVVQFFNDRKGKWQAFAVPSWHGELNAAATLASGSPSLSIDAVDYANTYGPDTTDLTALGNYIFLLDQDGTLWTPRVLSVAGTSPEILTLDANAAKIWTVGEFIVGFIYFVRFLNDELEFNYEGGPGGAHCKLAMQEIIDVDSKADAAGAPAIEGISFYDDFAGDAVGQTTNLKWGYNFISAWDSNRITGFELIMEDDLSTYTPTASVNGTPIAVDGATGNYVAN